MLSDSVIKNIENHPLRYLSTFLMIVVVSTYGVLDFFHKKEITLIKQEYQVNSLNQKLERENEINNLKYQLETIDRNIGEFSKIDLTKIIKKRINNINVPRDSIMYKEGFYALEDYMNLKHSAHSLSKEDGIPPLFVGMTEIINSLSYISILHKWTYPVKYNIERDEVKSVISPYISAQKVSIKKIKTLLRRLGFISEEKDNIESKNNELEQITDTLIKKRDIVGTIFAISQIALLDTSLRYLDKFEWEPLEIQKVNNVLYLQFRSTLKDISVNGNIADFYIISEVFLVELSDSIFVITVHAPTYEPIDRSDFQVAVNFWFNNLRIYQE